MPPEIERKLAQNLGPQAEPRLEPVSNGQAAHDEIYQRILEVVPAGVVHVSNDGAILMANREAQRILGLSMDEFTRRFVADFRHQTVWEDGTTCPVEEYPVSRCLRTRQPQPPVTLGVSCPDGRVSWAIYTALPWNDPVTGTPSGAVVTFVEITGRKQAEAALRESEERFRILSEAAFDAVAVTDSDLNYIYVNDEFLRMFGYELRELAGMSVMQCVAPEHRALVLENRRQGSEKPYQHLAIAKDGSRFPVEVRGKALPNQGRTLRVTTICDIRERLKAEEALRIAHDELEARVAERTVEISAANARLQDEVAERKQIQDELLDERRFLEHLLEMHERERKLVAYDIHDGFLQSVIATLMYLESFSEKYRNLSPKIQDELELPLKLLRKTVDESRRLVSGLRPSIIDELGVVAAIDNLILETAPDPKAVEFEHEVQFQRLDSRLEDTLFRMVQEALANVFRHSQTRSAAIRLVQTGNALRLEVQDWGIGFDAHGLTARQFGLQGIRERARLFGGLATIHSSPGAGTHVIVDLPLR